MAHTNIEDILNKHCFHRLLVISQNTAADEFDFYARPAQ